MRIGVIGGTGLYELGGQSLTIHTRYGDVEAGLREEKGRAVLFIPRHGPRHAAPPHRVNHKANIAALAASDVTRVLAVNTVGSLRPEWKPGTLVVPNDFIDFTGHDSTFHDNETFHVDMTTPYCPQLRGTLRKAAGEDGDVQEGVYACMRGPRLETPAEIRFLSRHADVVGMTGYPEVVLARERGLCYASVCLVSNLAAGLQERLPATEVTRTYKKHERRIRAAIERAIDLVPKKRTCDCANALDEARL